MTAQRGNSGFWDRRALTALERFRSFCRFEPETGCVVWTGGHTKGRGHHIPYPSFWFDGKRWLGHRWAANFIHGLNIENFHVDHCCPRLVIPNTLCVEHLQTKTLRENVELQHTRRKHFIHLQVGLLQYRDLYGFDPGEVEPDADIPFYDPPEWLGRTRGNDDARDCPF